MMRGYRGRGRGGGMPPRHAGPPMMPPLMGGFDHPAQRGVTHTVFDIAQLSDTFPNVRSEAEAESLDQPLLEAIQKRLIDLTPSDEDLKHVSTLIDRITTATEAIIKEPPEGFEIHDIAVVGAFRNKTMIKGQYVADVVITLKTLPELETIGKLTDAICEKLKDVEPKDTFSVTNQDGGFNVTRPRVATVHVLYTTMPANISKIVPDKHIDVKLLRSHGQMIKRARWFNQRCGNNGQIVRSMVRLLSDIKTRFLGFAPLTPWIIDVLAPYCVQLPAGDGSIRELPINESFRRLFRLLAAGLFLPGSVGIMDPCESSGTPSRCHISLPLEAQDSICYTAQTLLRVLSHGGHKHILGLAGNASVATEMTVWDGVVVTASEKVFEREPGDEDITVQDMELD